MTAIRTLFVAAFLPIAACGGSAAPSPMPVEPPVLTANAYILPGAVNLGRNAFGDEPVVIHKGELMRWRNADGVAHDVVADAAVFPEFATTNVLEPGGEQSFVMNTTGSTTSHCSNHPQMT
jgi:plastocyanin